MERITKKLLKVTVWCLVISLAFISQTKAQAIIKDQELVKLTQTFFKGIKKGNYEQIHQLFDDKLKSELNVTDLKNNIENMYKEHGKIVKTDSILMMKMPEYKVSVMPIYFEKSTLELRLAFNQEKKISGLFFTVFESKKRKEN